MQRPDSYLTLHENLHHHALTRPDKLAMVFEDCSYTFSQMYAEACRIARGLHERGVGQGDHVSIYLHNCAAYIPIYYALSMLGAVAVPLNYMLRSKQVGSTLARMRCRFLFTDVALYEQIKDLDVRLLKALHLCFIDDGPHAQADRLSNWSRVEAPCAAPAVTVSIHDPMMILFSSGTTGAPKGIILSHLNRILYFFALGMELGIRYDEVNLCTTPLYHNGAIFMAFNNLYFGSATIVHRKFDVTRTFHDIQKYSITNAFLVPTQLQQLTQSDERLNYDLTSLKLIASAGAPMATTTKEAILDYFPGVALHELYGLTEAGPVTNLRPADQFRKVRCAGQAFVNMRFKVVDPQGLDVPTGEVGEVVTQGPTLFDGYYKDEKATQAAWRDGWFRTGDLGKVDDEGYLYIVDRLKDMIITGGVNVYPKDIEDVLYGLPEIQDVAVIGIPNEKWGEAVHAIIALRKDTKLSEEQVLTVCREKLSAYQVPRSVEFRAELPRNPSGKLLKRMLREEFWKDRDSRT